MIDFLVRRGTLLSVILLIIVIFGVLAALRIPVQMIPDLEVRTINIQTRWPGATPQDVEKEILVEQEQYLRNLPSLQRMISNASTGSASINLEFPFGTDINEALIRVNNSLSQVPNYPENVDEPVLYTNSFSENAFLYYSITPKSGNPNRLNMDMMRDFIDDYVRTPLERLPGVSQINLRGGAERQVQILVDPARLAQRNLLLTEVRDAIRDRYRDYSAGDMESGKRRYLVRTVGRFNQIEEFENLIIKRTGDSILRLGDVADVQLGHFEIRSKSYAAGESSIMLAVRRESGSNVIDVRDAVVAEVEKLEGAVIEPNGMRILMVTDDVLYVEASVGNVWQNLAIGAALASLVMLLFMRSIPVTLIGMVGIPICSIAAFTGLLLMDRTINVISLAGIAFALGMTLDNAIVVLENIDQELKRHKDRFLAAIQGATQVWPAVLASTMTTVFVFAPVLFVEEEAGQLYSDIAIAIASAILISMVYAITIVPAASAHFLKGRHQKNSANAWTPFRGQIEGAIAWLVGSKIRSWTCIGGILGVTLLAVVFLTPPAEYLPEGEEPKTFSVMIAPPGYSLEEMNTIALDIQEYFLPYMDDEPEAYDMGETEVPALLTFNIWVSPQSIRIISMPKKAAHINDLMHAYNLKFRSYPGMRAFSSRGSIISSNDGGTRSVNLDISGPTLSSVYETAMRAYDLAVEAIPDAQINSSPSSLILGQPLIELRPKWERAAEMGFSSRELGYTIAALTDGAFVTEFFLDDDKLDIFLYSDQLTARSVDEIEELSVYAPVGGVVPLSSLVDVVETVDSDSIRRVNGRRTVTLNIIPPRSIALETGVAMVEDGVVNVMRESGELKDGLSIQLSGASDQLMATRKSLSGNFIVSIVLSYLLIVVIYRHWGYPLLILATVPLGIAGGIGGLWLLNFLGSMLPILGFDAIQQPFDMISMLGFLILLGTVVNNPILIVDRSIYHLNEKRMMPAQAVRLAVESRLRPIMMTTITTVCGLSPLVFIPGEGTELYRGVGAIVLFGLIFSTFVTLTFLPSLLNVVFGWKRPQST
ncbi:MAG: efflux RND transporter permease subunit [Opitutales bacterium]|nr:efflux RND transporter permease subunit [Opitutales bacterium]